MDVFLQGFATVLQPQYLLFMFGGVALGLFIGFLPGLSGGMGIGLMLPFTFHMEPLTALVFLCSIYTGGIFGGAVTAILLNTPGAPANLSTVLDGFPMARDGQPERAMGISLMSSFIGGVVGTVFLLAMAGPLADFSLKFGPGEMFFVAIFGLTVVGSLSDNVIKGIFSGLFGILLGTVGLSANGVSRVIMGILYLMDGIPTIPALLGLLALPAIYELSGRKSAVLKVDTVSSGFASLRGLLQGFQDTLRRGVQALLYAVLGTVVGIIPAAGSAIAGDPCLCCYRRLRRELPPVRLLPAGGIQCAGLSDEAERFPRHAPDPGPPAGRDGGCGTAAHQPAVRQLLGDFQEPYCAGAGGRQPGLCPAPLLYEGGEAQKTWEITCPALFSKGAGEPSSEKEIML